MSLHIDRERDSLEKYEADKAAEAQTRAQEANLKNAGTPFQSKSASSVLALVLISLHEVDAHPQ